MYTESILLQLNIQNANISVWTSTNETQHKKKLKKKHNNNNSQLSIWARLEYQNLHFYRPTSEHKWNGNMGLFILNNFRGNNISVHMVGLTSCLFWCSPHTVNVWYYLSNFFSCCPFHNRVSQEATCIGRWISSYKNMEKECFFKERHMLHGSCLGCQKHQKSRKMVYFLRLIKDRVCFLPTINTRLGYDFEPIRFIRVW